MPKGKKSSQPKRPGSNGPVVAVVRRNQGFGDEAEKALKVNDTYNDSAADVMIVSNDDVAFMIQSFYLKAFRYER